jgi:hypothetical protein
MTEQRLVVTQQHFDKTFNVLERALDFIAELADAQGPRSIEPGELLSTFMHELGLAEPYHD